MFFEASAKEGDNTKNIFIESAKIVYELHKDFINNKIEEVNKEESPEKEDKEDSETKKIEDEINNKNDLS